MPGSSALGWWHRGCWQAILVATLVWLQRLFGSSGCTLVLSGSRQHMQGRVARTAEPVWPLTTLDGWPWTGPVSLRRPHCIFSAAKSSGRAWAGETAQKRESGRLSPPSGPRQQRLVVFLSKEHLLPLLDNVRVLLTYL